MNKADTELPQIDIKAELFTCDRPLLDVRAPVEFAMGAFPQSENHPLINDEERQQIGLRYKQMGQQQAIELGHQLVSGEVKQARLDQWKQFIQAHPEGVLYCFRGGMRSKISQQWIYENTGVVYPRVKGGYKAMRRFLIDQLDISMQQLQPVMLGGRTGIGKTLLLDAFKQHIDLEGLFHHRGSVFGKHVTPQPSQIDIENQLSIECLKARQLGYQTILLEDEGANIGSRRIPENVFNRMKASPLVLLEADVAERVRITFDEYISEALAEHRQHYGEQQGFHIWAEQLRSSFNKIQRRLGGARHKTLTGLLEDALMQQQEHNDSTAHKLWIESLLVDYYDPMYDYQLSKKLDRVVFKGHKDQVIEYLKQNYKLS